MPTDQTFFSEALIHAPAAQVFAYHEREGALERLTPPWEALTVLERSGGIRDGGRVVARMGMLAGAGPIFEARHFDYRAGESFSDEQVRGPFEKFTHVHSIRPEGPGSCTLQDDITFRLPLAPLSNVAALPLVYARLKRMFRYRHTITVADNERLRLSTDSLRVAITGASGLIGTTLTRFLTLGGHRVTPLVRRQGVAGIYWNPESGEIDGKALEGFDVVVHLAGENVAGGRWSEDFKQRLLQSRVKSTRLLAETLASLKHKPRVFLCASGVSFYGDTGSQWADEDAPQGQGFLAQVAQHWEAASAPAKAAGIRTVNLRTGVVLSSTSGALKELLQPARFGISSVVGSGEQYMSWIGLDDTVYGYFAAMLDERLSGIVNLSAPTPVPQRTFVKTLALVLGMPAIASVPKPVARAVFGREKADELLVSGQRVRPAKLESIGFDWLHETLEPALRHLLGR